MELELELANLRNMRKNYPLKIRKIWKGGSGVGGNSLELYELFGITCKNEHLPKKL